MLIVCNGMMRSGSTLQYNLVRCLVEKMGLGRAHGFFVPGQLTNYKVSQWGADTTHHVINMHDVHPKIKAMAGIKSVQILYIYRDIRDVAASAKRKFKCKNEKSFFEALDWAIDIYSEVKKIPEVLWQKYEDVVTDIPTAIREQAHCLNLVPSEDIISEITMECSLESAIHVTSHMQKTPTFKLKTLWNNLRIPGRLRFKVESLLGKLGIYIYVHDKTTLLHYDHISSFAGESGYWKKELTEGEIGIIQKRYKSWIVEAGYPL